MGQRPPRLTVRLFERTLFKQLTGDMNITTKTINFHHLCPSVFVRFATTTLHDNNRGYHAGHTKLAVQLMPFSRTGLQNTPKTEPQESRLV
jgi:hypothetical protein